ncbi:MAG: hypothetical protein AAF573_12035 [Bacteroidota bacterium]
MSNFWNKFFLALAFVFITTTIALAQPKDNNPYTRLGIGELTDQFFFPQASMGGMTAAFHDPYHMNISNPASYSRLRSAAFELGLFAEYASLNTPVGQNNSLTTWNGNLSYLSLGFPLKNPINEVLDQKKQKFRWGMNFTLIPYSNVNYNIEDTTNQVFADTLNSIDFLFQGTGGTYKVMWGNSLQYKNLSVGVNLGYFFGKIENDKFVVFPDNPNSFDNFFNDDFSVGGVTWSLGAQYDIVLKTKEGSEEPIEYVTIGAYGNSRNRYTLTRDRFWTTRNFSYGPGGTLDTIFSISGSEITETTSFLPGEIGLGIAYNKKNRMRLGADFKLQSWSGYVNDLIDAGTPNKPTVNSYRVAVGAEFLPDVLSYNNYLKKVRYRFGAFYGNDPRSIQGDQITKYGVTLGVGMPVILPRQEKSFVNLGVEFGQIGIADALQRTYFKINLGFTLNDDKWFLKRKFN